eukprot:TRINITY_DN222_c0_g1_i1.p2 TRINITY_DN222_c0_g1~~TRINITY_DN222_c0_g1_i1.p2  ORF type:complete len:106 (-),score=18.14 TRINITY_DN222_c0_g1_i1:202-519(-)
MAPTVLAKQPLLAAKTARKAVVSKAVTKEQKIAVASAAAAFATAIAPAAQAAQEVAMTAEGEAAIIQVGWGVLAASFSLSLAMVVWGRSGLQTNMLLNFTMFTLL